MTKYFIKLFNLTVLTLVLSGCAISEVYNVNIPVRASGKNITYSQIKYPDFSLHVRLLNDVQTYEHFLITVIPVYLSFEDKPKISYLRKREPYNREKEFRILLAIMPESKGYQLYPNNIELRIDDKTISPVKIEGPIHYFPDKNIGFPEDWSEEILKEKVQEGYVFSVMKQEEQSLDINEDLKISLARTGLWSCYELVFNHPTPSTDRKFNLKIDGLSKEEQEISIQSIEFKETIFNDIGSIP
ncbi:hypothetical protein [Alkalimarinus alittae]|uniref:Lipoprotein n=1 Tax=Alkalimarinus alittae TaxID=2961619 RepID=A0ABY6N534_9ALTE|nr:hypothetical protein [Alkalimarinus alittae]UZE97199.1 hypothetical protein NKI27_05475 [Alkalimarinus alittae]